MSRSRSGTGSASDNEAGGDGDKPKKKPEASQTESKMTLKREEVRLNRSILMQGISSVNCDKREPVDVDKQFPRVTHLHLQNKGIDTLASFHHFRNLTVLYLYDNRIREITGLENARHLEALYLQRNRLDKITGLLACRKLRKLYLGQNGIMVVEGLHLMNNLAELHIEQQKLRKGEQLIFDPTTLDTLSTCLKVLNISGNGITTLDDLAGMGNLESLEAQHNAVNDLERTALTLMTLQKLKVVDLRGNPVAKSTKYEEKVIGHCQSIETLDGKTYSDNSRRFMSKFCEMKALHLRRSLASMTVQNALANSNTSNMSMSSFGAKKLSDTRLVDSSESKTFSQGSESNLFEQLYPSHLINKTSSTADELNRRLSRINTIGQYSNPIIQETAFDLAHAKRHDLKLTKLVKPQEISLPQFNLAMMTTDHDGTDRKGLNLQAAGRESSVSNFVSAKNSKTKIYKGLGFEGFQNLTNLDPSGGTFGKKVQSSSSFEGMMPTSHGIKKVQSGPESAEFGQPDESGDKETVDQRVSEIETSEKVPEPKIFKLPPWPHILRNCGKTTEKVNFI